MGRLSLSGISKNFNGSQVIDHLDLDIADGEFMVFVGPSGCGKSTLLRMIAGLEELSSGEILLDGSSIKDLPPSQRGIAMVFQNYALYPHMTVFENIGFALRMAGMPPDRIREKVLAAAKALRLDALLERLPRELSGGQRQRVAIGRAIVRKPDIFLFDEPLSNLDAALRVQMRIEITRLHQSLGNTMIYVTHDQVEAMTMGQRIAVFNAGRIEQVGGPMELYSRPCNEFVASFLGTPRINILPVSIDAGARTTTLLGCNVAAGAPVDWDWQAVSRAARIGVRPEHWNIARDGSGLPAEIVLRENLGDSVVLHARIEGADELVTLKFGTLPFEADPGENVLLQPEMRHALLFDEERNRISVNNE